MSKGKFIVFEGTEAAGKTTLLEMLEEHLKKENEVYRTREPGGTTLGKEIRKVLLDHPESPTLDDTSQTLLYAAAYRESLLKIVIPAVDDGGYVLSDRTNISSFVYQRKSPHMRDMMKINDDLYAPDIVFILTTDFETMQERVSNRGGYSNYRDFADKEQHDFLVAGYKLYAEMFPRRTYVLDSRRTPDELFAEVRFILSKHN